MLDTVDSTAFNFEQGQRARKLFAAVVLAALDDAIADDKKYGNGPDQIARWARSRDGREVLSCAGIDPNERVVKGLMEFVSKGVRTSVALSREESERRHALELDQAEAERMAKKLAKGQFDLNDLSAQLSQMQKMGGMEGIMGLLPGVQKVKKQIAESGIDDSIFRRQQAIISSMTKLERKKPDIINGSRRARIAKGCGRPVNEVNRLRHLHKAYWRNRQLNRLGKLHAQVLVDGTGLIPFQPAIRLGNMCGRGAANTVVKQALALVITQPQLVLCTWQ